MATLPWNQITIMLTGIAVLLFWLFLFSKSGKYNSLFESLTEKEYPLKELYSTGYAFMELLKYNYKSKRDRKLRQEVAVMYGDKFAEYYLRVIYAQQATFAWLLILCAFITYGFTSEIIIFLVMLMFAALAVYYYGTATSKKIMRRSEEMLVDFSDAISKLALLTNAGMILREAWEQTAKAGKGSLYTEMQKAVEDMNNGISDVEAIRLFGVRCIIPEIKKMAATIIQGLTKGNQELAMMLQEQSKEIWMLRKQNVTRQGEKAASKLLIPMLIMFIGILIMIIVPIFTNLGI